MYEAFFRIIQEEYLEFGTEIEERPEGQHDLLSIRFDPTRNPEFAQKLYAIRDYNPILKALGGMESEEQIMKSAAAIQKLEQQGILPSATYERMLARVYVNGIEGAEHWLQEHPADREACERAISQVKEKLEALGAAPLSYEEIRNLLLEHVIIPELGKPKQGAI